MAAHLTSCLVLVRPVGMTDEQAEEWLVIAAQDLEYPEDVLVRACRDARRVCRHHSEIVPKVVELCEETMALRRNALRPRSILPAPEKPKAPPVTQADCDRMSPELRRIGLASGALVENRDGTVSPAPDTAA